MVLSFLALVATSSSTSCSIGPLGLLGALGSLLSAVTFGFHRYLKYKQRELELGLESEMFKWEKEIF